MNQSKSILQFIGSDPLFVGGTRFCFAHPKYPDRCVKVLRPDRTGAARKLTQTNWKRFLPASSFDDQIKEIRAYQSLIKHPPENLWRHVPEYFGTVDTDFGKGIVTRLFRNADGSFPRNLQHHIDRGINGSLKKGIEEFIAWLSREVVITRDILAHNIICVAQADDSYQVLIVDGIGNSEFVPLASWFKAVGRLKVQRKVNKFSDRTGIPLPSGR